MKLKRIFCLAAIALLLLCFAGCTRGTANGMELAPAAPSHSVLSLENLSAGNLDNQMVDDVDDEQAELDDPILLSTNTSDENVVEDDSESSSKTAGIILMVAAGLCAVVGVVVMIIKKRS